MKINIKGIIKKNKDFNVVRESVDYYNKIVNILEVPYFQNLRSIGIDEDQYETIFSKLYNQPVSKYDDSIFNDNGKPIYYENSDGEWVEWKYDDKGNLIYNENSKGSWVKIEYDLNGNEVYYENSNGYIEDNRPNNINESVDYYSKLINVLQPPYFRNLESIGIDKDQWETIFSKLYGEPVNIDEYNNIKNESGETFYQEDPDGFWVKYEYNSNGNETYHENSDGFWEKWEYDNNGNRIYFENSNGEIIDKRNNGNINESVDHYSKLINILEKPYFQNMETIGIDRNQYETIFSKLFNQPVSVSGTIVQTPKGRTLYYEDNGFWYIFEYDENGNQIYGEYSKGTWVKREYDDNGNELYYEDSNGEIIDNRNNGNINESVDHYDKLVSILKRPYFKNLDSMGIDRNQYETLLPILFNQPVTLDMSVNPNTGYWGKRVFNDKGVTLYYEDSNGRTEYIELDENDKEIYYESSNGYWVKKEFDENGNRIYFEDSDGEIIDNRNNNLNESVDNDRYYDKIINILDKPYFKNLDSMGITVEEYEEIFSRMFGEEVLYDDVMDSKYLTIGENDIIYREDSNGFWVNYEYGVNEYFFENSFGYWFKKMYDTNGNEIYYEDSDGEIIDNRNNGNLNESTEDYYDKIVNILEPPYFRNLRTMGIPKKQYETIFSKLYNQPVSLSKDEVVDSNGKRLYFEESRGEWEEYKYDDNGNNISYENSEGEWSKREYDINNNLIFTKQIGGYWEKREYDINNNLIFIEKLGPYGSHWNKYEYDDNGNKIYNEDSSGHWIKKEYDEYGNQIYSENSNGYIIDKRNNN